LSREQHDATDREGGRKDGRALNTGVIHDRPQLVGLLLETGDVIDWI
jgi:hypothetical protein